MPAKLWVLHTVSSLENEAAGTTICVRRIAEELGQLGLDACVYSVGTAGSAQRDGYLDQRFGPDWTRAPCADLTLHVIGAAEDEGAATLGIVDRVTWLGPRLAKPESRRPPIVAPCSSIREASGSASFTVSPTGCRRSSMTTAGRLCRRSPLSRTRESASCSGRTIRDRSQIPSPTPSAIQIASSSRPRQPSRRRHTRLMHAT